MRDITTAHAAATARSRPVFVDDSGRRRRRARVIGGAIAIAVLGYVAVVALTFAGAPGFGGLGLPGLAPLSQPSGDAGATVGPQAQEQPLPRAVASPGQSGADPSGTVDDGGVPAGSASGTSTTPAPFSATTSSTEPPTTPSTTAYPGQGSTTTVHTPSSTVPSPPPSHGPPTSRPPRP